MSFMNVHCLTLVDKNLVNMAVDSFITALHTLAEHCDHKALREEMIRDRIVVGISNTSLSEKLYS